MDAFVRNLFRDLRDRHLLLPALALLVALVAVPKLLAKDPEAQPPAAAAAISSGSSAELGSAVLADGPVSVRDYRKRLEQLKNKNPFKQQLTPPPADDGTGSTGQSSGSNSSGIQLPGESSASPSSSASLPSNLPGPGANGTSPGSDPSNPGNANGGKGGNPGKGSNANNPSLPDIKVVKHLYTRRADLLFGIQGNPKLRENVMPMTTLPNDKNPVAAYLGTDEKGKRAAFVVSKDVTLIGGEGACVPSAENCLYITLQKSETATLTVVGDAQTPGQTYELRLVDVHKHRVPAE